MITAMDMALYIIKQHPENYKSTFDGNMKLQKMLFFTNMIYLAENGELLFDDEIKAWTNGCVVVNVRNSYKTAYSNMMTRSKNYVRELDDKQYIAYSKAHDIFEDLPARELSNINHQFEFWKKRYEDSIIDSNGNYDQTKNTVTKEDMLSEIERIEDMLFVYEENKKYSYRTDVINDVTFYFDNGIEITDELMSDLEDYTYSDACNEGGYMVCKMDGELVVY